MYRFVRDRIDFEATVFVFESEFEVFVFYIAPIQIISAIHL